MASFAGKHQTWPRVIEYVSANADNIVADPTILI